MELRGSVDEMDQSILRILSTYERLTPLQLWYELAENDAVKRRLTEKEILSRLESLRAKGFVERITGMEVFGDSRLSIYRMKTNPDMEGKIENMRAKMGG